MDTRSQLDILDSPIMQQVDQSHGYGLGPTNSQHIGSDGLRPTPLLTLGFLVALRHDIRTLHRVIP